MTRALVGLLLVLGLAQDAPVQRFRTTVEAVRVDVLVLDGNRPVSGLTADDFLLKDSGVAQHVDVFSMDDVPVSVMLALDTSTSVSGPTLDWLKAAAAAALDAVGPEGRAALITFASAVNLAAGWSPPGAATRGALSSATAGGMTALYDATFAALTSPDTETGRRGLVILFSDGADTASWLPQSAVLETARRTDAVVYAVVRGGSEPDVTVQYRSGIELWPGRRRGTFDSPSFVAELTELTGGRTMATADTRRLRSLFAGIIADFRSRYVLAYSPAGVDHPGWHPIEVTLRKGRGKVTARRGYVS